MLNFVSNAIKFTFEGSIEIEIGLDLPRQNILKVCIRDTGIGISEENLSKLFQLYNTFDNDRGTNKQGLGLGLVIAK